MKMNKEVARSRKKGMYLDPMVTCYVRDAAHIAFSLARDIIISRNFRSNSGLSESYFHSVPVLRSDVSFAASLFPCNGGCTVLCGASMLQQPKKSGDLTRQH